MCDLFTSWFSSWESQNGMPFVAHHATNGEDNAVTDNAVTDKAVIDKAVITVLSSMDLFITPVLLPPKVLKEGVLDSQ